MFFDTARHTTARFTTARLLPTLALLALICQNGSAQDQTVRPNVVIITADNLGYGDVGCYGNRTIKTPHLDRLAVEGVRCTDFYTASPTCTVSRACLLTGRYPQRHGLVDQLAGLAGNYGIGLNHHEILLPQLLKPAGYRTACFGKWNIGFAKGSRPTERGFDTFFGHVSGNIDYYTHLYNGHPDMYRGTHPVRVAGYSTDLFAEAACAFIRRSVGRPFFVYLPFNAPHYPNPRNKQAGEPVVWQAPARAFSAYGYDPRTRDAKQRYQAVVTAMDAAIGRVVKQLDDCGLTGNTLVIFFSDNGAFMLHNRGLEVASNRPLRNGGVTLFEGGIRVPCIIRWPARIPAGTVCHEPFFSCDFFATVVQVAGARLPEDRVIDGRDCLPTVACHAPSPHRFLFFRYRGYAAVRSGHDKLLRVAPTEPFMLFDLARDVSETHNLADEQPRRTAMLAEKFRHWEQQVTP